MKLHVPPRCETYARVVIIPYQRRYIREQRCSNERVNQIHRRERVLSTRSAAATKWERSINTDRVFNTALA